MLPRSIFRRPGSYFQDIALTRNIRARESVRVQLRAEFYNLLNHANREVTGSVNLNTPFFAGNTVPGVLARYAGVPRQVVVAAKIIF